MLKNLHVITGIIFALTIFCLLQVVTGGLFYSAVSNDRHNFQNSGVLNAQQESLSDSVNTLVKTRVTVTRVAIRYLKNQRDPASLAAINKLLGTAADSLAKAEAYNKEWQKLPQVNGQEAALTDEMQKSWNQMHEVMRLSIEYLRADNYQAYGDLDAQQAQDEMEAVYNRWRAERSLSITPCCTPSRWNASGSSRGSTSRKSSVRKLSSCSLSTSSRVRVLRLGCQ